MKAVLACILIFAFQHNITAQEERELQDEIQDVEIASEDIVDTLEKPLYNPFIERYMLDEIKALRQELADQRRQWTETVVNRELSMGDRAMTYSTNTVTYFFYLIAAVSSILVIVGWTSIRDVRDKVHRVADREVQKLVETYEKRLRIVEAQLTQKTESINENRIQIEQTQEVHSLWLRAAQEHGVQAKLSLYDEILKLRPGDGEALTYKADAVLELNEPLWAKNLCLQALDADHEYVYAHYQLACANVALGLFDEAIHSLSKGLQLSENLIEDILKDDALAELRAMPDFQNLLSQYVTEKPGHS